MAGTPRAHVSEADRQAIGAAFAKWVTENGHQPADGDWPAILGPDLFKRAAAGGFFAAGAFPGQHEDDDIPVEGFTVVSGSRDTGPGGEISVRYYALFKDGVQIATKDTNSLEAPDPDAWAAELGYSG